MKSAKVYLVGAGPGKPDLITVRGQNILKEADVVIYDYLIDKHLLKKTREGAELICADTVGKKRYSNGKSNGQARINRLMVKNAFAGKRVVRLKSGDPFIFSRCSDELRQLSRYKVEYEVVPGITASSAAACLSGIPLTDRRFASSCVLVTGHEDLTKKRNLIDWKAIAKGGTVVIYMAVRNLDAIVEKLLKFGKDKDTAVAIIQDASLVMQKVVVGTLKDIALKAKSQHIKPPAIVIIGKAAESEKRFNWLRKTRCILFTGLSEERFFMKGTYFHLPLIEIQPMEGYKEFDGYLRNIRKFDWIVFASRYGAEYFFKRLKAIGYDSRILSGIKIAAIGNSTKNRLLDFAISADLVPTKESSEGLIEEFKKVGIKDKDIFLPRSNLADKGLSRGLAGLGARVTSSFAYKNIMPGNLPDLDLNYFGEIMFTSPSTVRNFKRRYKRVPGNIKVRCIGDVTLKEARRCRLLD